MSKVPSPNFEDSEGSEVRVRPEVVGRGCRAATTPPAYSVRTGAAARFVPRLNGAGTPQRGVRYRLQQLREAPRSSCSSEIFLPLAIDRGSVIKDFWIQSMKSS